jgi:hypothetical protein
MVHWKQSYNFGKQKEEVVLPIIKNYFEKDITSSKERYAKYDFFDDEAYYELKSRTNTKNCYPTTMITKNKVESCDKDLKLLFNFRDCLAYIKYDEEQFKHYSTEQFSRLGADWDEKPHLYIPVDHLTVIKTY